jgi:nicotinamide-nucleotide amidase
VTGGVRIRDDVAAQVVAALLARDHTVAAAESLTGGLVADAFVQVPGTSAVFRGAVVAYATAIKHELLDVDEALLDKHGAVDPDVAAQMAAGVRRRLSATWGVATTGAAGPEPQDGAPPGRVFVAVSGPGAQEVVRLDLSGDRDTIRREAGRAALELLLETVRRHVVPASGGPPDQP